MGGFWSFGFLIYTLSCVKIMKNPPWYIFLSHCIFLILVVYVYVYVLVIGINTRIRKRESFAGLNFFMFCILWILWKGLKKKKQRTCLGRRGMILISVGQLNQHCFSQNFVFFSSSNLPCHTSLCLGQTKTGAVMNFDFGFPYTFEKISFLTFQNEYDDVNSSKVQD